MLNREKRKALESLVGADVADQLVTALQGREKSARADGVSYKALEPGNDELIDMIAEILGDSEKSAVTEKCTPGTKDGKFMGKETKAEDDTESASAEDEESVDDMEEDTIESLLTEDEIDMLAEAVAARLMSSMDEMKSKMDMLDQEMKTRGYGRMKSSDDQVLSTLKSYTESQEDFSEALVSILEEVNARLKSIEDHQKSDGHVASTSLVNMLKSSDGRMSNMSAQEAAAHNMWFQNQ